MRHCSRGRSATSSTVTAIIRVTRGDIGAGTVDAGLSGADLELGLAGRVRQRRDRRRALLGVEVLLLHGQPVHPGDPGRHRGRARSTPGYPAPISNWNWPARVRQHGDRRRAVLAGGSATSSGGGSYIRVTPRGHRGRDGRRGLSGADLELELAGGVRQHGDRCRAVLGVEVLLLPGERLQSGDARRHRGRDGRRGLSGADHRLGLAAGFRGRSGAYRPGLT